MLCVFWDRRRVLHWELLPKDSTVDATLYIDQLHRLHRKIRNRRNPIVYLDDNARPHVSNLTAQALQNFGWERLQHPPYSPDLAPSDYHLFRGLEHFLRGQQFENDEQVKVSLQEFFASKDQSFFRRGIYCLPDRWLEVINNEGDYIL